MMSGSRGASAPFGIHDIVFELARKCYIMYPKMARSAFDPDIIVFTQSENMLPSHTHQDSVSVQDSHDRC